MATGYEDTCYLTQILTSLLIQNCPKDTLNLVNSIGYEVIENFEGSFRIVIGGDKLLNKNVKAPYAIYTNEPHKDRVLHYRKVYPGKELTYWIDNTIQYFMIVLYNMGVTAQLGVKIFHPFYTSKAEIADDMKGGFK